MIISTFAADLDAAVKTVCPHIDGVSIGRKNDRATWLVHFTDEATEDEKAAAAKVLAEFPTPEA